MSRSRSQLSAVVATLTLLGAGGAYAQAAPPRTDTGAVRAPEAPPSVPESASPETRARVRGSHTVDVIAPGEKVDTILGRMRMERPIQPPRGDSVRPPPGSDSRGPPPPGPGRMGPPRSGENGRTPPLSPRTDGTAPHPGSGPSRGPLPSPPSQPPPSPPR